MALKKKDKGFWKGFNKLILGGGFWMGFNATSNKKDVDKWNKDIEKKRKENIDNLKKKKNKTTLDKFLIRNYKE